VPESGLPSGICKKFSIFFRFFPNRKQCHQQSDHQKSKRKDFRNELNFSKNLLQYFRRKKGVEGVSRLILPPELLQHEKWWEETGW
jgi:hypothetical protein